jgi:ubiquinone/menaquinone biosynthesis C-methylase UbiE
MAAHETAGRGALAAINHNAKEKTIIVPQKSYTVFADIYDTVMRDVDYIGWAEYVLQLAHRFDFSTSSVMNLACGTANLEMQLAQHGIHHVEGLDGSRDMLSIARKKAKDNGLDIGFTLGQMQSFKLSHQFPLILCLYDSINYLCEEDDVLATFQRVAEHLLPGGGFIFDVTTEYNILANFSDFTFAENFDDFSYIWENRYNLVTKVCVSDVTVFQKQKGSGEYRKTTERHSQKIYPQKIIRMLLDKAGFDILGDYSGMTMEKPTHKSERIHYACRLR